MQEDGANLAALIQTKRDVAASFLAYPNVFGSGVGRRTARGDRTDELAIVVFVDRKLPLSALRPEEVLPRSIDGAGGEVRVDVVERERPRFTVDQAKYRPLLGGCEIRGGGRGTLGGVLYDATDTGLVLLTCNHVLTLPGQRDAIPAAAAVQQPDNIAMGVDVVGRTKRIVPMVRPPLIPPGADTTYLGGRWFAPVDAGIVELDPRLTAHFEVIDLGKHPYVPFPPSIDLPVKKRGRTTELTAGTIQEVGIDVLVTDDDGQRMWIGFPDHVFTVKGDAGAFSERGDSGSLVIDADGAGTRGMVFAAGGGVSYACNMGSVMAALQLETPCTGALNAAFWRALQRRWMLQVGLRDSPFVSGGAGKIAKFRALHLKGAGAGTLGAGLEQLFQELAPELASAIAFDEDFAGLLDLAIGDWLVQPTVFDMLEYRLPDDFAERLGKAFDRLPDSRSGTGQAGAIVGAFRACAGRSMREALQTRVGARSN
jgi:hypothetical protein